MAWLSERLKELLGERKLSIQGVARELNIPRAYLSQIASGSRIPSEELVRRLAEHFKEDPEEWAFKTRAQPTIDEIRRKYPTIAPQYMRNVTDREPPYKLPRESMEAYLQGGIYSWSRAKQFIPLETIEQYADETLKVFAQKMGRAPEFPLDGELVVRQVFGLDVRYDDEGVLDGIDASLLGCLYPDGSSSPWSGLDRIIAVNSSRRYQSVTVDFTILHEGGHYLFHHPQDAVATTRDGVYCRSDLVEGAPRVKVPPREWQASRFASEVLMPRGKVSWLLDGKQPPEIINLDIYGSNFRAYFGVSQAAMEKRLHDLGYKCAFGRYAYANVTEVQERPRRN